MADAMAYDGFEQSPPKDQHEAARFEELKRKVAAWDDPALQAELKAARPWG
jgi:hypothetical protein